MRCCFHKMQNSYLSTIGSFRVDHSLPPHPTVKTVRSVGGLLAAITNHAMPVVAQVGFYSDRQPNVLRTDSGRGFLTAATNLSFHGTCNVFIPKARCPCLTDASRPSLFFSRIRCIERITFPASVPERRGTVTTTIASREQQFRSEYNKRGLVLQPSRVTAGSSFTN